METPMKWFIEHILRPKWVAFQYLDADDANDYELGLMVWGVVIALYKGDVIISHGVKNVRLPGKREFGESIFPLTHYGDYQ
jgi:hypothetical protein